MKKLDLGQSFNFILFNFFNRSCCSEKSISFHYLNIQDIYKVHYLWSHYRASLNSSTNVSFYNINNEFMNGKSYLANLDTTFENLNSIFLNQFK